MNGLHPQNIRIFKWSNFPFLWSTRKFYNCNIYRAFDTSYEEWNRLLYCVSSIRRKLLNGRAKWCSKIFYQPCFLGIFTVFNVKKTIEIIRLHPVIIPSGILMIQWRIQNYLNVNFSTVITLFNSEVQYTNVVQHSCTCPGHTCWLEAALKYLINKHWKIIISSEQGRFVSNLLVDAWSHSAYFLICTRIEKHMWQATTCFRKPKKDTVITSDTSELWRPSWLLHIIQVRRRMRWRATISLKDFQILSHLTSYWIILQSTL